MWVNTRFSDDADTLPKAVERWQQFRFRDIVDPAHGGGGGGARAAAAAAEHARAADGAPREDAVFRIEHEVRSLAHEACPLAKRDGPLEVAAP